MLINRWIFPIVCLVCLSIQPGVLAQDVSREYQIKAVFLYNFTQFVQWPEEAFTDATSPMVIGVLGEDPFGSFLDETIRDEVVNNHRLVVERYESVEQIKKCHVLFIGGGNNEEIRRALNHLSGQPILTVSDADGFTRMGGMIRLLNEEGRIRLRVNVDAAAEAKLIISSKLLRLADIRTQKNN